MVFSIRSQQVLRHYQATLRLSCGLSIPCQDDQAPSRSSGGRQQVAAEDPACPAVAPTHAAQFFSHFMHGLTRPPSILGMGSYAVVLCLLAILSVRSAPRPPARPAIGPVDAS